MEWDGLAVKCASVEKSSCPRRKWSWMGVREPSRGG